MTLSNSGERLHHARISLGLSGEAFGSKIGASKTTISRWEAFEVAEVSEMGALAIELVYGIRAQWILRGEGPMRAVAAGIHDPKLFIYRPLIVGAASCGPGGVIQDPGPEASQYALRRDFAERIFQRCGGGTEEDLFFLLCRGESMTPTIRDKEIVLLNAAVAIRNEPKNNGIYLVKRAPHDDEARVKRVRIDHEARELVLGSDNRAFSQVSVPLDGIPVHDLVLGRVVWVGRYLLDTDPPPEDW
jgi:transcriptional regulator with XRE-family HTH domain